METVESEEQSQRNIQSVDPLEIGEASSLTTSIIEQIESAVIGDREFFELLLTAVISRGHVHLEDVPGTGKTVVSQILAQSLGVEYNRIQFTPDLLPADVTGSHIYNEEDREFEFQRGPVFANVVLADEINRAPPKTQAALLEAMGEKQVSVDGESHALPKPFFVIATQNPVEQEGTFELPEAQQDRFSIKTAMGYPGHEGEKELLDRRDSRWSQVPAVEAVTSPSGVRRLQASAETVAVEDPVKEYIIHLAEYTREDERVETGVSPRGVQKMFEAARGYAIVRGRDYVTPHDVKHLAEPLFAHRIVLTTDAAIRETERNAIISDGLEAVPVPNGDLR